VKSTAFEKTGLWLLQLSEDEFIDELIQKAEQDFDDRAHHSIICKNCGHTITHVENMISINGHHHHTFVNRADIAFDIGCFSLAEGCMVFGTPTMEDTWFQGYAWSYAACSNCMIHLGWFYQGEARSFFGLILDRLSETIRTH